MVVQITPNISLTEYEDMGGLKIHLKYTWSETHKAIYETDMKAAKECSTCNQKP
jgi:hypothetical protein